MSDEKYDQILLAYAQQAGSLDNILDGFFGFLLRRTDFFTGYSEKNKPTQAILKAFDKYWNLGEEKRMQEAERRRVEDAKRKEAAEKKKKQDEEEYRQKQEAKAKTKSSKIEEVPEDTPVGVQKVEEEPSDVKKADKEEKNHDEEEEDKSPPPVGNGGTTDDYTWTQTLSGVEIFIPVKPGTKAKEIVCDISLSKFKVGLKGQPMIIDGKFHDKVKPDDCMWMIDDNKTVHITLEKHDGMKWWSCVCEGHPEIDTKKIVPENSNLGDLDGETRSTVEKMMYKGNQHESIKYDQRAKAAGKPSSDQKKQHDMLEKFKQAHPEMDFSNAKINYGGGSDGFNFGQ